jgi:hypothetical protein
MHIQALHWSALTHYHYYFRIYPSVSQIVSEVFQTEFCTHSDAQYKPKPRIFVVFILTVVDDTKLNYTDRATAACW